MRGVEWALWDVKNPDPQSLWTDPVLHPGGMNKRKSHSNIFVDKRKKGLSGLAGKSTPPAPKPLGRAARIRGKWEKQIREVSLLLSFREKEVFFIALKKSAGDPV